MKFVTWSSLFLNFLGNKWNKKKKTNFTLEKTLNLAEFGHFQSFWQKSEKNPEKIREKRFDFFTSEKRFVFFTSEKRINFFTSEKRINCFTMWKKIWFFH